MNVDAVDAPGHAPRADERTAGGEWRSGWPVVLSAFAGMSITPLALFTLGLFIQPLEREFGWTRAAISSGFTVNAVIAVALSPFMGILVDRVGPRRIGIAGVIVFCTGFAMQGAANASLYSWWAIWGLIAIGALALKPTVWLSAVTSRFEQRRGMAVAATLMGTSVTAIIGPPIAEPLIESLGWRGAYAGLALIWGAAVLPLVVFFFYGARDLERVNRDVAVPAGRLHELGMDGREALRSRDFLKLIAACAMTYFCVTGLMVHLVPIVTAEGVSREAAALMASFVGIGALAGRALAGYVLDRYSPRLFGAVVFTLPAVAALLLLWVGLGPSRLLLVSIVIGIANGTEFEVASILLSRRFGLRNFGLLMGTVVGLLALMSGISPALFGFVYDQFATYQIAFILVVPLSLVAGLLIYAQSRFDWRT